MRLLIPSPFHPIIRAVHRHPRLLKDAWTVLARHQGGSLMPRVICPGRNGSGKRIAIFIPSLNAGGAQRVVCSLAGHFLDAGHSVDLLTRKPFGDSRSLVPAGVRIHHCVGGLRRTVLGLATYLTRERPDAMLATMTEGNLVALTAVSLVGHRPRLVIREANTLSCKAAVAKTLKAKLYPFFASMSYPFADGIVGISQGVADDLVRLCGIDQRRIALINNPSYVQAIETSAADRCPHPWFEDGGPPVIIGAGRLVPAKGFDLLVEAMSDLRRSHRVRLVILGEGPERAALEARAKRHGMGPEEVLMPGFVRNPYAWMARARIFVLSSRFEGFPNALVEGMALCGAVVATDCPSGPREILDGGKFGRLVPMDDSVALAAALRSELDQPSDRIAVQTRARTYSLDRIGPEYLKLLLGTR